MEPLVLDLEGLYEYQQDRPPYLFIDFAEEVIPGVSAKGYKDLKSDDWFFDVHFPGDPAMPGMLQVEALAQMCALTILSLPGNKCKIVYMLAASDIKFIRKVVPGDRLHLETTLLSWKRGIGTGSGIGLVKGEVVCQASFTMMLPDVLKEFKVRLNT